MKKLTKKQIEKKIWPGLTKDQALDQITRDFKDVAGPYIEKHTCLYLSAAVVMFKGAKSCAYGDSEGEISMAEFIEHIQPWVNEKEKQVMNEMDPREWYKKREQGRKELNGL